MRADTFYASAFQRAGTFSALPAVLREFGVDPGTVFDGSGIDLHALAPDSRVPLPAMLLVLDRASRRTNCPHLGLVVGARFSMDMHGLLGRTMKRAATLREALTDFVTWQQGYSTAAVVYLNKFGEDSAFGFGAYDRTSPGTRQLYDTVLTIGCRMLAELTEGQVTPLEVLFCQRRPDDIAPYRRMFKSPIRFDQEQTCLVIDARSMDTPLPGADAALREQDLVEIRIALADAFRRTSARVRHVIRPLLHDGKPSMADAARTVALHPRTLRRRLASEGTTFEAIRDEVRFTVARELLDMTDLPIAAVAPALAFSSHGAFIAAFRRWTGTTPKEWRARRE
jgi:AraC-like DNA-binding protein